MKRLSLVLALLCCPLAQAEDAAAPQGDAEAGKTKAAVCAACHGADGNSSNPQWPKLAGQHPSYLVAQLKAYQDGSRANAIMAGQATGLSEQDMLDLAAYFAAQTPTPGVANPDLAAQAKALYLGGRAEDGIPACTACHGPRGLGNAAAAYPVISGQHAEYTAIQLRIYRDGERTGTASAAMMSKVAEGLSDADIQALASYLSGLH